MRCIRRCRAGAMLAVQAAALAGAANLWAGIAFDPTTSSIKITHDANINDPNDVPFVKTPSSVQNSNQIFVRRHGVFQNETESWLVFRMRYL